MLLLPTAWLALRGLGSWSDAVAGGGKLWDGAAARAFETSLLIALGAAAGAVALGLPAGWRMARGRAGVRTALSAAGLLPLLLPTYAVALAWLLLLNRQGPVGAWVERTGRSELLGPGQPWVAALVLASCWWPLVAWIVRTAARTVPEALEDAARLELPPGAAAWNAAWPQVRVGLTAAGLLVFLLAFADFGAANTLGIATFPREIVNRFNASYDFGETARLALPALLGVVPLVALNLVALRKLEPAGDADSRPATAPVPVSPGGSGVTAVAVLLGAALPPVSLAAYSLGEPVYARVWEEAAPALATSASLGVVTALLVVLAALCLGPLPAALDLLVSIPYALPGSLFAIAAIHLLNRPGPPGLLYATEAPLLWVYPVLFLPFALRALAPGWRRVDPGLLGEAALAGAGAWDRFRAVTWPALAPHALLAAGIVFLLASREMDATALLRLPGLRTVAFLIHDYLHFYPVPNVAALCLVLVTLQVGAVLLGTGLWRRWVGPHPPVPSPSQPPGH